MRAVEMASCACAASPEAARKRSARNTSVGGDLARLVFIRWGGMKVLIVIRVLSVSQPQIEEGLRPGITLFRNSSRRRLDDGRGTLASCRRLLADDGLDHPCLLHAGELEIEPLGPIGEALMVNPEQV